MNPDILVLDEPATGLMPLFVSNLREIIRKLNEEGMTILLVDERVPFTPADRIYFMVKGKIEYSATREDLKERKDILVRCLSIENLGKNGELPAHVTSLKATLFFQVIREYLRVSPIATIKKGEIYTNRGKKARGRIAP